MLKRAPTYDELAIGVVVLLVAGSSISFLRSFVSRLQWKDFEKRASNQEKEQLSRRSIVGPDATEILADWREIHGRASTRILVSSLVEEFYRLERAWLPALISIAILCLAFFGSWPHSFYVILRIVVTLSAAYLALRAHGLRSTLWVWTMVGLSILFNPIVPIRLHRADWRILDLCGAALFIFAALAISRRDKARRCHAR